MKPSTLHTRITNISRELALFVTASFAVGMAGSLVDSTLNNFLNDTFALDGFLQELEAKARGLTFRVEQCPMPGWSGCKG